VTIPHDPWLVALSIAIAIQGSFVGLSLARGIDSAEGFRRRLAIAGSAITLATGVWSMHFVAMLAANFPSAVDYLVLPTLISFLICVIVVGVGVYAAHMSGPPAFRIGTGALAMGLGVSLMHYVGMSAVHLAGPTSYAPSYVVASIVVAIAASAFALWTIDSRPTRPRLFLGAIALGLAISGMHYTAMAGMRLDPLCYDVSRFVGAESALSRNTLALLATIVAFGVSGAFLLSLVPDARAPHADAVARSAARRTGRRTSRFDPGGKGRAHARHRRERYLRRSRQRPLHLCPRRREGIFLQSFDQRA
jgi:NO-binding membrane sensor protein with MHYT domain